MVRVTTGFALEDVPMSIGRFGVPAAGAALGRVPWVDLDHGHAQLLSLVPKEEAELPVRPTVDLGALCFAKPAITDAVQLFDRDRRAPGDLREPNDGPADLVVDRPHEPRLSTRQPFEHLRDGARRVLCLLLLERRANVQVAIANVFGVPSSTHPATLAVGRAGKDVDAPVDPDDGVVGRGLLVNGLLEAQDQEDLLGSAVDRQTSVAEGPVFDLVLEAGRRGPGERNVLDAPVNGPDGQLVWAKRHVSSALAALENDSLRSKLTRPVELVLVGSNGSVLTGDVSNAGDSNLSRKPGRSCISVGKCLELDRIGQLSVIKGYSADEVAGGCPCFDGTRRHVVGQPDLELDGTYNLRHNGNLSMFDGKSKRPARIPPSPKGDGPLRESLWTKYICVWRAWVRVDASLSRYVMGFLPLKGSCGL